MTLRRELLGTLSTELLAILKDAQRDRVVLHIPSNLSPVATEQLAFEVVARRDLCSWVASELESRGGGNTTSAVKSRIAYDVLRVRNQKCLFFQDHMSRLQRSSQALLLSGDHKLHSQTVAPAGGGDGTTVVVEWQRWFAPIVNAVLHVVENQDDPLAEQNVKIVVWRQQQAQRNHEDDSTALCFGAFFIPSFYPPRSWYLPPSQLQVVANCGASLACLYGAARDNPALKIVQATLRQRAADQQKRLGVFESILVHAASDAFRCPEGSRSNYILMTNDGQVLSSQEEDILMGCTLLALRRHCKAQQIPFEHRVLTLRDICAARSVCMLGTSVGVLPIQCVTVYANEADKQTFLEATAGLDEVHVEEERSLPEGVVGKIAKRSSEDPLVQELIRYYDSEAY